MQPAIFVGHGSPMNALAENTYTRCWQAIGQRWPRPPVIVALSAHWLTSGTVILQTPHPKTIHDFYGFPQKLFAVNYPAPGSLEWADQLAEELSWAQPKISDQWGLDHGVWSVLLHMYPAANIPVVPVSLDVKLQPEERYRLGQSLRRLREKGAMLLFSGDLVHNLHEIDFRAENKVFDWAQKFDEKAQEFFTKQDHEAILNWSNQSPAEFQQAHPTPDHFWPFLYFIGALSTRDQLEIPVQGVQHGSISMTVLLGS